MSAQLKEKVSPLEPPGRYRGIIQSGRYFRNSIATALASICSSRIASAIWRRRVFARRTTSAVLGRGERAERKAGQFPKTRPPAPLGRQSPPIGTRKGASRGAP